MPSREPLTTRRSGETFVEHVFNVLEFAILEHIESVLNFAVARLTPLRMRFATRS